MEFRDWMWNPLKKLATGGFDFVVRVGRKPQPLVYPFWKDTLNRGLRTRIHVFIHLVGVRQETPHVVFSTLLRMDIFCFKRYEGAPVEGTQKNTFSRLSRHMRPEIFDGAIM